MGAVLLATDFTARVDRAEARAVERAAVLGASLHVLAVDESRADEPLDADSIERELRTSHETVDLQVIIDRGEPWQCTLDHADRLGADLIVIGPGDRPNLKARFLGSTAERIIHRAPMPVLVVRDPVSGPYRKVAAATDFSAASRHAVVAAARLLPEAEIALLHAYRVAYEGFVSREGNEAEIRRLAEADIKKLVPSLREEVPNPLAQELHYGTPDEVLPLYVREYGIELVVLGAHGAGGAFEKLLGGTAERLLASLECDVMVVREPPRA